MPVLGCPGRANPRTDGLGSTTELANSGANVTDTYRYDAFGAIRTSAGASAQPFRFTGDLQDSQVARGRYHLRARYYDPAQGRFLSRDPFAGLASQPQSQNPYVYVSNNCTNFVDPVGLVGFGPRQPAAKQVCVSWLEMWDLRGSVLGLFPSFKLFRFELHALYYRDISGQATLQDLWANKTHLGAGWHIDRSSLEFGSKEGGGAFARARFGAGGANPFGFWPVGFNADVVLRQWLDPTTGEVVGSEVRDVNPFHRFTGLETKSGLECGGWQ